MKTKINHIDSFEEHYKKIYQKIAKRLSFKLIVLFCTFYFTFFFAFNSFSQGVSINTTGNESDAKAMLDIDVAGMSPTKAGLLIPRMTTTERNAITATPPNPESLLIYNTTTQCFEFYANGFWQTITCGCASAPSAAGTISGSATVCPGQIAVLFSVPAIAGATSYIWSYSGLGAIIVGSTNSVIVYFSGAATSGNLTVTGTNACGNGTVSSDYPISVNSTAPNITAQPSSVATCPDGGTVSFTITASGGLTYQWQEYTNSWNNVSNAGVYSGANSAILIISSTPLSMDTYKYRCVVSGTCTNTTSDGLATLTVNPTPPAPTGTSSQSFCSGASPTVANLSATGTTIKWYAASSGGSALTTSVALINGTHYFASQTVSGCESANRFDVTATVNTTPLAPTGTASQSFCSGASPTVANLTATGTAIQWYTASSGGSALGTSEALVNGTHYYATSTVNNCESATRFDVTATINANPSAPTGTSAQSFCSGTSPTVANLTAIGTAIQWYAASSGGSAIATSLVLVNGTHYFATQTVNNCESTSRFDVTATLNSTPSAPTGTAVQSFCSGTSPTVANLSATGTSIQWYAASSGGSALATSVTLVNGTHYFATQTVNSCESTSRFDVTASVSICYLLTSWPYIKPITISNTSGSALTNYQVKHTITFVAGKMKADFSDLRFTDGSCTQLNYYIETYTASTSATVWVKVPSVPTSGTTIYMHYGNSSATSLSNGTNTFEFFDDFEDGVVSTSLWTKTSNVTESGGILYVTGTSGWTGAYNITSVASFGPGVAFYSKGNMATETFTYTNYGFGDNPMFWRRWENTGIYPRIGATIVTSGYNAPINAEWKIEWKPNGSANFYINGNLFAISEVSSATKQIIMQQASSGQTTSELCYVRKFVTPEPTASIGSETSCP
ncbi:MAG: DUF2341 domain-containing protein [Bacteroidetes bacterium]|nr:DUF2341 domain-containing protein [Bacteroidota bacterium]